MTPYTRRAGHFYVRADLTGPTGITERLEFLVDPGATFLAVPRVIAERRALKPTRIASIRIAGGATERWPIAEVRLSLGEVDPVGKRRVPTDG